MFSKYIFVRWCLFVFILFWIILFVLVRVFFFNFSLTPDAKSSLTCSGSGVLNRDLASIPNGPHLYYFQHKLRLGLKTDLFGPQMYYFKLFLLGLKSNILGPRPNKFGPG